MIKSLIEKLITAPYTGPRSVRCHESEAIRMLILNQFFLFLQNENGEHDVSAWDRYVGEEYELLLAEEGGNQKM